MDSPNDSSFTHVRDGQPAMVDIAAKSANKRTATAEALMTLGTEIMGRLENRDLQGPKGPVFQTAIIAGTMAVKKTSELIPFCHPLPPAISRSSRTARASLSAAPFPPPAKRASRWKRSPVRASPR
jgi:molybdenum cofactor biosynthesis enzyme